MNGGRFAFNFIAAWIDRIRQRRRVKRRLQELGIEEETQVLKGKLTYGALGGIIAAVAVAVLGDGVLTQADLDELGQAALALVAVYGRYRATKA